MDGAFSPGGNTSSPGGKAPAGRLRFSIRKAFTEAEVVLEEWDAAGEQGAAVLRAVQNAAVRLRDFVQRAGRLGVVSAMGDTEEVLKANIAASIERLLRAMPAVMTLLAAASAKIDKVVDQLLIEQAELQPLCSLDELWEGAYLAQPSIAEMAEWLHDALIALRRELALRNELVKSVSIEGDESAARALDLWEANVFLDPAEVRGRAEAVRIHCVLAS